MTAIERMLTELHRRHVPTMTVRRSNVPEGGVIHEEGICSCGQHYNEFANHVTHEILGRFMVMPTHLAEDLLPAGERITDN